MQENKKKNKKQKKNTKNWRSVGVRPRKIERKSKTSNKGAS